MLAIMEFSTGYQVLGLLHVLAAVTAFGPLFLYTGLHKAGETQTIARLHMKFTFPSLVLLWVFGMGLVGMSDKFFRMQHTWIAISLVIWLVLIIISLVLIRPAVADPSEEARSKMAAGVGVTHLLFFVALILMIFKPGA